MSTQGQGAKRIRVRRACLPCSRRKRKCNGLDPCDICEGYGYTCTYRKEAEPVKCRDHADSLPPSSGPTQKVQRESWNPLASDGVSFPDPTEQKVNDSENGLLVVSTSQYLGRQSAEAFPRFLALQARLQPLPKLQPFAWNLESTTSAIVSLRPSLCSLISLEIAQRYVRSFFLVDAPVAACFKLDKLLARCEAHWAGDFQGPAFEAVLAGIVALTAIVDFSSHLTQERGLHEHAHKILSNDAVLAVPSIEILAALVLRYLYLRATATPHVTWLWLCTAMHMAESLGLHKQYNPWSERNQDKSGDWDDKTRAYLFWVISAGNRLGSHDLGRTPVILDGVTRKLPFAASETSSIANFCRVAHLLPLGLPPQGSEQELLRFSEALREISGMDITQPLVKLIAGDVCFTLYRRVRVNTNQQITRKQTQQVVGIGREAVSAVRRLLGESKQWWNMISTLFQFCCVLLAIDSADSLPEVKAVMTTISLVSECYPGNNIAEALTTLEMLISAVRQRKQLDFSCLEINTFGSDGQSTEPAASTHPDQLLDDASWTMDDLDWIATDMFFNPNL